MASDTLSINLKLLGQNFPMTISRVDEVYYRDAEKLINRRYNYYANTYPQLSKDMHLIMMALEIAVEYKSAKQEANLGPLTDMLKALVADVEQALDENA